jgi:hypothetical protein
MGRRGRGREQFREVQVGDRAGRVLLQRDPVPALGVLRIAQALVCEREIVRDLGIGGGEIVCLFETRKRAGEVALLQRGDALLIPGAGEVGERLVDQAGHPFGAQTCVLRDESCVFPLGPGVVRAPPVPAHTRTSRPGRRATTVRAGALQGPRSARALSPS